MITARESIERAKARMILAQPWWATLLLHLRIIESESIQTMATDGNYLLYNPAFVMALSAGQLTGVLIHEVAHCALMHPSRRAWREPERWNIACDATVNSLLLSAQIELPPGCIDPAPPDKTAEEIYEEVKTTKILIIDVYAPGELGAAQSTDPASLAGQKVREAAATTEKKWRDILASARGLEPASLRRVIEGAGKPRVNWREELARWVSARVKCDEHTWSRPSRRVAGLPGWKRVPRQKIAICIDTSGSVSALMLNIFCEETRSIMMLYGMEAYVISADADIFCMIPPGAPFPETLGGGGGTDFRPAIKKARELNVDGIIYFTDGNGEFGAEPPIPIIWALSRPSSPPWGEKIQIEKENR